MPHSTLGCRAPNILLQAINHAAWRDCRAPSLPIVAEQLTFVSLLLVLPPLPPIFWQGPILGGSAPPPAQPSTPQSYGEEPGAWHCSGSVPEGLPWGGWDGWGTGGREEGLSFVKYIL